MAKIVLLSCTKSKLDKPSPAQDLYSASPMFKKTLEYGKSLEPDKMYILSAKHHLVPMTKVLAPYDLKDFTAEEKQEWSDIVLNDLKKRYDINKTKFVFLAGEAYKKYLEPELPHTVSPLKGLRIGQQKQKLGQLISEIFQKIKKIVLEEIKKFKK